MVLVIIAYDKDCVIEYLAARCWTWIDKWRSQPLEIQPQRQNAQYRARIGNLGFYLGNGFSAFVQRHRD